jgi:competence protein ComEA
VTWSPRALRALAVLLGALLLVVAYWWWQGRARPLVSLPEVSPTLVSSAMPTPAPEVTVHVRGKVRQPGVISLPVGSRVIDAIEAAGGLRPGVSTGALNLARVLVDGEQVAVGIRDTGAPPAAIDMAGTGAGSSPSPVDINAASAAELEALPGIGPVLASRIVQWRTDNGPFSDVEILGEVSGIGDALLAQLRPLVRVG